MPIVETKFIVGEYKKPVTLDYRGARIWLSFGYNKKLIEEIKMMDGAKWHGFEEPPIKRWSIADSARNRFQIRFLEGKNPYSVYDQPLVPYASKRPLYNHQIKMVQTALTYRGVILACEMGTGKTLAAIETIEYLNQTQGIQSKDIFYVGPKAGVMAVSRELVKWNCTLHPKMMTYEGLTKLMKTFDPDKDIVPRVLILDESSKVKSSTAQRAKAAQMLSEIMRHEHDDECYIIEMSGTPAPKEATDWWMQAEIACPGFIKEGNVHKFKSRLCIIEERQSITGGVYPHIVTWKDDSKKCGVCGQYKEANTHQPWYRPPELDAPLTDEERIKAATELAISKKFHDYIPSKDEISYLYERMKGLVLVQFKKDCLDLPEKQYRIIEIVPPSDLVRAMKLIKSKATRAIEALTLIRELSDGFQYTEKRTGETECSICHGTGKINAPISVEHTDTYGPTSDIKREDFELGEVTCDNCGGVGKTPTYERATDSVTSPKDEIFIDLLDEHEEIGRFIVWGGFTGTIDRLTEICHKYGWSTLRVDGRGYKGSDATGNTLDTNELLDAIEIDIDALAQDALLADAGALAHLRLVPDLCALADRSQGRNLSRGMNSYHANIRSKQGCAASSRGAVYHQSPPLAIPSVRQRQPPHQPCSRWGG